MKPSEPTPQSDSASQGGQAIPQELASARSAGHSRRVFLFKLSLLLNGAVGAVLAVPIVGYLLGPALKKNQADNSWINLGPLSDFPEGETRLVNFRNPVTTPWDGQTGDIPCWVRRVSGSNFQVFAINCAHLVPGALVRSIQALSLPLPRRRLLRGRLARLGPARARPLRVRHKIIARQL